MFCSHREVAEKIFSNLCVDALGNMLIKQELWEERRFVFCQKSERGCLRWEAERVKENTAYFKKEDVLNQ